MRRWGALTIAAAALVGGALVFAGTGPASASTVPLRFEFGTVLPGATSTDTQRVSVARASIVTAAVWTPTQGPVGTIWSADICDAHGSCSDFADLTGARVDAGVYTVTMSVTLPESSRQGEIAASGGFVQLIDESAELAATGGTMPWLLALAGAAFTGLGAVLLAHRRSKESAR